MLLLFVLAVLLAAGSPGLASETIVNRRVLEGQKGYKDVIQHVKAYEVHDFTNHASTRRALESAGDKFVAYDLHVLGRRMTLELERYDSLFAKGYKHYLIGENGRTVKTEDAPDCIYKGTIAGETNTAATVSLCDGMVHASVYHHDDSEKSFSIQPLDSLGEETTEHVVYRHRDLLDPQRYCGVGRDGSGSGQLTNAEGRLRRLVSDGHADADHDHDHHQSYAAVQGEKSMGSRRNLESTTKYIGISVVNDKLRYEQKKNNVLGHSSFLFATANSLYAKLGDTFSSTYKITLEIVSMYTFVNQDPWTYQAVPSISPTPSPTSVARTVNGEVSADDLLNAFEAWRVSNVQPVQNLASTSGADLAHLLTGFTFVGSTIGLAHLNGVCRSSARSGETQATDIADAHQASTITHEVGHNLGSQHTDTPPPSMGSCENANAEQIMSAGSAYAFTNWDACTVEYFRREFDPAGGRYPAVASNGYVQCAETPSAVTFDGPRCGDGIVQPQTGEECDCINQDCTSVDACCNGLTCKLIPTAECSAQDTCCTGLCKIINDTAHVCRAASGQCDLTETCDGTSGRCPFDLFKTTGTACTTSPDNLAGTCYSKKCVDATQECITRGLQNPPSDRWVETCAKETVDEGSKDCVISCSTNPATPINTCRQYVSTVYYADGTQCQTGKGCYQGACLAFAEIPVALNPNCSNSVVDNNETDVDCGGANCFGCAAKQLCLTDKDCLFPSNCNKTETVNANGYIGLGRCSSSAKAGSLDDLLNQILRWFRENPFIWGPILGALVLFLLICCFWPRSGGRPPIAKAGYYQAQASFRNARGPQTEVPTAVVVQQNT